MKRSLHIPSTPTPRQSGNWKLETGNWKMENGKWKLEAGSWKLENGKWKMYAVRYGPRHAVSAERGEID